MKCSKALKVIESEVCYVGGDLMYRGRPIFHSELALRTAMGEKHRLTVEFGIWLGDSEKLGLMGGDTVVMINVDSARTDCTLYTNTRTGGLCFAHSGVEVLKPWEFSLEKYVDGSRHAAAVEYTRRKLNKLVGG